MSTPRLEDCDRLLLVEGYSDLLFFAEVLEHLGKSGIFIKQFGGKEDLHAKVEIFLTPEILATKQAIAVVIDADENPAGTAQSYESLLSRISGQTVLNDHWTSGPPEFGLMVVPGQGAPGEIETLAWQAWAGDPANAAPKACIETFRDCMAAAGVVAHSPSKGLVGSYLALRYDEDPRLGPGARTKAFNLARPEYTALLAFLAPL